VLHKIKPCSEDFYFGTVGKFSHQIPRLARARLREKVGEIIGLFLMAMLYWKKGMCAEMIHCDRIELVPGVWVPRLRDIGIDTRVHESANLRFLLTFHMQKKIRTRKIEFASIWRENGRARCDLALPLACCGKEKLDQSLAWCQLGAPRIARIDTVQNAAFTWALLIDRQ
jgi:hypothetical protein